MNHAPIPYAFQSIDESDIAAVTEALRSDWLTQGPTTRSFEEALCKRVGATYGVAVCNATSGLHLACLAAGLGPGDRMWTSPNTFVASANCARYCGAEVDFVDIDPASWCMDADLLEVKLLQAAKTDRLPKVVIPVAFGGRSCDMRRVRDLANLFGFVVIEDASHAVGASYLGAPVGCGTYAHMTVFSFHPVKIMTTGEGGAIVTNDANLHERMTMLRSHGITRDGSKMESPDPPPWYYEMLDLGFNYRINDIQAALGLSQLKRLDGFLERRRYLAERYRGLLTELPITLPLPSSESAWHLYVIRLSLGSICRSHREVFERLRLANIGVNLHYIPVHLQPYYRRLGFSPGDFPRAEEYYAEAMSLPLFSGLADTAQDRIVNELQAALL